MFFLLLSCKSTEGAQRDFSYLFLNESQSWDCFSTFRQKIIVCGKEDQIQSLKEAGGDPACYHDDEQMRVPDGGENQNASCCLLLFNLGKVT